MELSTLAESSLLTYGTEDATLASSLGGGEVRGGLVKGRAWSASGHVDPVIIVGRQHSFRQHE